MTLGQAANRCAFCDGPLRGYYALTAANQPAHKECVRLHRIQSGPVEGLDLSAVDLDDEDRAALAARPKTWGECCERVGPCPWISCRYHLALEVTETGRIVLTDPSVPPDEMQEPCALRIAQRGEQTLEQVATRLGVTRQRVQQLEGRALRRIRRVGVPT